jgi:hypothetical protein
LKVWWNIFKKNFNFFFWIYTKNISQSFQKHLLPHCKNSIKKKKKNYLVILESLWWVNVFGNNFINFKLKCVRSWVSIIIVFFWRHIIKHWIISHFEIQINYYITWASSTLIILVSIMLAISKTFLKENKIK